MKLILFMATSINGTISRKNGNEDFLSHQNWENFKSLAEKMGCLITSRKAYENIKSWNEKSENLDNIKSTKIILSKKSYRLNKGYILANSPENALEKIKSKTAIISAGPNLTKEFLRKNLINEIIINVNPILIGNGINIFEDFKDIKLGLIDSKKLKEGIIQLHYKIK